MINEEAIIYIVLFEWHDTKQYLGGSMSFVSKERTGFSLTDKA